MKNISKVKLYIHISESRRAQKKKLFAALRCFNVHCKCKATRVLLTSENRKRRVIIDSRSGLELVISKDFSYAWKYW